MKILNMFDTGSRPTITRIGRLGARIRRFYHQFTKSPRVGTGLKDVKCILVKSDPRTSLDVHMSGTNLPLFVN